MYILNDVPELCHKANNIFMHVGWVSFFWFYTFLDLIFVLGGPLKGIKSGFLFAHKTVIILGQYHYYGKLGQRTTTFAIIECKWRKCISEVVMTIKFLSFSKHLLRAVHVLLRLAQLTTLVPWQYWHSCISQVPICQGCANMEIFKLKWTLNFTINMILKWASNCPLIFNLWSSCAVLHFIALHVWGTRHTALY
jgi:hypothetical protein